MYQVTDSKIMMRWPARFFQKFDSMETCNLMVILLNSIVWSFCSLFCEFMLFVDRIMGGFA